MIARRVRVYTRVYTSVALAEVTVSFFARTGPGRARGVESARTNGNAGAANEETGGTHSDHLMGLPLPRQEEKKSLESVNASRYTLSALWLVCYFN